MQLITPPMIITSSTNILPSIDPEGEEQCRIGTGGLVESPWNLRGSPDCPLKYLKL